MNTILKLSGKLKDDLSFLKLYPHPWDGGETSHQPRVLGDSRVCAKAWASRELWVVPLDKEWHIRRSPRRGQHSVLRSKGATATQPSRAPAHDSWKDKCNFCLQKLSQELHWKIRQRANLVFSLLDTITCASYLQDYTAMTLTSDPTPALTLAHSCGPPSVQTVCFILHSGKMKGRVTLS